MHEKIAEGVFQLVRPAQHALQLAGLLKGAVEPRHLHPGQSARHVQISRYVKAVIFLIAHFFAIHLHTSFMGRSGRSYRLCLPDIMLSQDGVIRRDVD